MPTNTEPCAFRIIEMEVTEDVKAIEIQFKAVQAKYATWQNDPVRFPKWQALCRAGADALDPTKRAQIVKAHLDAYREFVTDTTLSVFSAGPVPVKILENLAKQGTKDPFHLSEALIRTVSIPGGNGGTDPDDDGDDDVDPVPVANPRVGMRNGFPFLTWQMPFQGCDRIIVRAKAGSAPSDPADGREVFDGRADQCPDLRAEAGVETHYAIYSFSGQSTKTEVARITNVWAAGVTALSANADVSRIELSWQPPATGFAEVLVFRSPAGSAAFSLQPDGMPVAGAGGVLKVAGQAAHVVEDGSDGIVSGQSYEYAVFVAWTVNGRRLYSSPATVSVTAVVEAEPVVNLVAVSVADGIRISWTAPSHRCEKVVVVKSAEHQPENPGDGDSVPTAGPLHCIDRGLTAGTVYYYSVFSLFQGRASARVSFSKCFAGPLSDLSVAAPESTPGAIVLSWTVPPNVADVKLFRRKGSKPDVTFKGDSPVAGNGEEVALPPPPAAGLRDEVPPEVEYHYCGCLRYADGQWSAPAFVSGRALEAPLPVAAIGEKVMPDGRVELAWAPLTSTSGRAYKYHLWRRPVTSRGAGAEDKKGEDVPFPWIDAGADPGCDYEYAIESSLGPLSSRSPWKKVFVTKVADFVTAVPEDGAIRLEWIPPRNAKRMRVVREGGPEIKSELTWARDRGLKNGAAYSYSVAAVFSDVAGREVVGPTVGLQATPDPPAPVIAGLRVGWAEGAVQISWLKPMAPTEAVVVCRLDAAPVWPVGHVVPVPGVPAPVAQLDTTATEFQDHHPGFGAVSHYALFAVKEDRATYSGSQPAALYAPVSNLKAKNRFGEVILEWDWPEGIEAVRIRRRNSAGWQPLPACAKARYQGEMLFRDRDIAARPAERYTYEVRSIAPGGSVESLAVCLVDAVGGKLPEIACELKKKVPVTVVCKLPKDWPSPCALLLVRNDGHYPLHGRDGEVVDRFVPGARLPKEVVLADPTRYSEGYYKIFLDEEDPLMRSAEVRLAPIRVVGLR